MQRLSTLVWALVVLVFIVPLALAQTTPAPQSPTFLVELWAIVQPIVVLLVSVVGPVLVAWIGARLASLLKIADENQRKDLEQKFSDALHQSALNALKFSMSKLGVSLPTQLDVRSPVVKEAIDYVRSKNPDAVDAFRLTNTQLAEIIMSKAPDVLATIAQANQPSMR
jgi:hypothetical protein